MFMEKIKLNNKSNIAIIILLYIFCASFPFCLFIKNSFACLLASGILMLIFLTGLIIYLRFSKTIKIDKLNLNIKNVLILSPLLLMTVSNYFYLPTVEAHFIYDSNILYILLTTLLIVLVEEIIFRGILISNIVSSKEMKILISSLVFAICHISRFLSTFNPFDLTSIAYAFVLGLITSTIYVYGGSLSFSFIFHLLFNVLNQNIYSLFYIKEMNYLSYFLINIGVGIIVLSYLFIIYFYYLRKKEE